MGRIEGVSYEAKDLPVSTLAVGLCLGVNALVYVGFKAVGVVRGLKEDTKVSSKKIPAFEFTYTSVLRLSREILVLSFILGLIWVCENAPLYSHDGKDHSKDFFWFVCFVILFFAFGTVEHDPKSNDLVNRDQTEEWKGWMQVVFLLYHYFHAEEVYNAVRVMISCYVWMTGFGNFSFFYIKRDFSFVRFAQMMWRLNFSVVFLCLLLNNMYMLYYICPLHTFYFLLVFVVMRVYPEINHTKWEMRQKLAVTAVVLYVIWEFNWMFDLAFFFLSNQPHPGAAVGAYGIKYEWHFRSGLDHYSTFFGMLFALNFPQATQWIAKVESLSAPQEVLIKGLTGTVLFIAFLWWATYILPLPKLEFNSYNPYTFMIPLLTYLYFRNITPGLRQVHLGLLATIGKYTLETYLMQHHIWLTSNAKTVLVLVPGYPKVNMIACTTLYFLVAKRLYRVTMATRAMLVPDDADQAMTYLGMLGLMMGCFGLVAWLFQFVQGGWILFVLIVLGLGILLFTFVLGKVSMAGRGKKEPPVVTATGGRGPLFTFLLGLFASVASLVLLPSFAPVGAPLNAGPLRPPKVSYSKEECLEFVGNGSWAPSTLPCLSNAATCSEKVWIWDTNVQQSCKFSSIHKVNQLQSLLGGRQISFVGDESVYDIAVSFHRQVDPLHGHPVIGFGASEVKKDKISKYRVQMGEDAEMSINIEMARSSKTVLRALTGMRHSLSDAVVLGAWSEDATSFDKESLLANWASVGSQCENLFCILVLPPVIVEDLVPNDLANSGVTNATVSQISSLLKSSPLYSQAKLVINMNALTWGEKLQTDDGIRYSHRINSVAVQQVLNGLHLGLPPLPPSDTSQGGDASSKGHAKKGSGGGVAHSPFLGLSTLLVAGLMLITMDSYAGVSFLFLRLFGFTSVTWEESTFELHKKIGVQTGFETIAQSAYDEEDPLAPNVESIDDDEFGLGDSIDTERRPRRGSGTDNSASI